MSYVEQPDQKGGKQTWVRPRFTPLTNQAAFRGCLVQNLLLGVDKALSKGKDGVTLCVHEQQLRLRAQAAPQLVMLTLLLMALWAFTWSLNITILHCSQHLALF